MKYVELLENLKLALALRYNDQKGYQRKIANVLGLSPSVVSRRLSGDAPFTVEEVTVICGELDIPVDEIFTACSRSTRLPMEFIHPDLSLCGEESYEIFAWPVELFSLAARSDDSTFYATCNTFPDILNPSFGWVARFWEFQRLFSIKVLCR